MVRYLLFFVVFVSLLFGLHAYVGLRLLATLSPMGRAVGWGVIGVVVAFHLINVSSRMFGKAAWQDPIAWVSYVAMGLVSLLVVLTLLRDLGWVGAKLAGALPTDPERRRALLAFTNAGIVGASVAMTGVGLVQARRRVGVVDVTVPIANLPAALEGFTIAQISDVHVGPTIKRGFIEDVVADVNALNADMIAVTGDIVDGPVAALSEHTAPFADLKAKHGAFFVTGNHEYYSGALEWCDEFARLGMRILNNAHTIVEHAGEKIVVGGVTDISAGGDIPDHAHDADKAIAGAPADAVLRILLAHQPRSAYAASKAGFDLQLSGHTHGGQFFPWSIVVHLAQPFVQGLHQLDKLWVYVSRGTGYWGPPNRLGVPAEITRIVLTRAP